jgi:hypothetical protein
MCGLYAGVYSLGYIGSAHSLSSVMTCAEVCCMTLCGRYRLTRYVTVLFPRRHRRLQCPLHLYLHKLPKSPHLRPSPQVPVRYHQRLFQDSSPPKLFTRFLEDSPSSSPPLLNSVRPVPKHVNPATITLKSKRAQAPHLT